MIQIDDLDRFDHSSVRWIQSGASPLPVSLIQQYADIGIDIHQIYGLTESCGPACLITGEDAIARIGSTGRAFFHTDVRIVDADGDDVAPHAQGEVWVRGRHVMLEYWNRPEATAETITQDGWLRTGDVATIDDDGFIYIQDRIKDMIISGGENVYPAEIENVILTHPEVAEVAVIGQPSAKWGESPFAVVVRKSETVSEADILAHCDGKLARFKLPKGATFIDLLPRNPNGKVLKRLLREDFPGPASGLAPVSFLCVYCGLLILLFGVSTALAATKGKLLDKIVVKVPADEALVLERHENAGVKIDGFLDESIWQRLSAYDEFVVLEPDTLMQPEHPTRVRVFYDADGLYFGVDMDQPVDRLITRLSGRDRRDIKREQIGVTRHIG